MAAICNIFIVFRAHCPLKRGDQVTASQITQSTKISYKNMKLWCKRVSDGCGQFKQEKQHIAPLTPQLEVTHEL